MARLGDIATIRSTVSNNDLAAAQGRQTREARQAAATAAHRANADGNGRKAAMIHRAALARAGDLRWWTTHPDQRPSL